jgi:hypothetical protein
MAAQRPGGESPGALAEAWYERYSRELRAESGDPEALISSFREQAEQALPDSTTHRALSLFLERLRERGEDEDDPAEDERS